MFPARANVLLSKRPNSPQNTAYMWHIVFGFQIIPKVFQANNRHPSRPFLVPFSDKTESLIYLEEKIMKNHALLQVKTEEGTNPTWIQRMPTQTWILTLETTCKLRTQIQNSSEITSLITKSNACKSSSPLSLPQQWCLSETHPSECKKQSCPECGRKETLLSQPCLL